MSDFTAQDLAAINSAIASGELTVHYNNITTTFRSMDDLIKARNIIKGDLEANGSTNDHAYISTGKGLA